MQLTQRTVLVLTQGDGVWFVSWLARRGYRSANAVEWRINRGPNRITTSPWGPWKPHGHDPTSSKQGTQGKRTRT